MLTWSKFRYGWCYSTNIGNYQRFRIVRRAGTFIVEDMHSNSSHAAPTVKDARQIADNLADGKSPLSKKRKTSPRSRNT